MVCARNNPEQRPEVVYQRFPLRSGSASAIAVDVQTLAERHAHRESRPHGHAFFEIIADTSSSSANTVFVVSPAAIHECRFAVTDALVVLFVPDGVAYSERNVLALHDDVPAGMRFDVFRRPMLDLMQPIVLEAAAHASLVATLVRMRRELQERAPGYDIIVGSALRTLLVELARTTSLTEGTTDTAATAHDPHVRVLLRRVFADIDAHFEQPSTLAAYLTTRLRRLTGRTHGEWVIERRMIEARRLLAATALPISGIAERIGYAESESFIRRFRARHDVTPAAWQAKSRSTAT